MLIPTPSRVVATGATLAGLAGGVALGLALVAAWQFGQGRSPTADRGGRP